MKQSYAAAPAQTTVCGINLHSIWNVEADSTYDVRRIWQEKPVLIAIRTRGGRGRMILSDGSTFDLGANTLLVVENQSIARYHRLHGRWDFWWFKFTLTGSPPFPLNSVLAIPAQRPDKSDFAVLFRYLKHPRAARRIFAASLFMTMLTRWLAFCPDMRRAHPLRERIEPVVEAMHNKVADNWTVEEMAKESAMSERAFRKSFREIMGEAPKRFYDRLRLTAAAELLRFGPHTVAETADHFRFSSPFHFSKAFKRHFGCAPATLRGRTQRLADHSSAAQQHF